MLKDCESVLEQLVATLEVASMWGDWQRCVAFAAIGCGHQSLAFQPLPVILMLVQRIFFCFFKHFQDNHPRYPLSFPFPSGSSGTFNQRIFGWVPFPAARYHPLLAVETTPFLGAYLRQAAAARVLSTARRTPYVECSSTLVCVNNVHAGGSADASMIALANFVADAATIRANNDSKHCLSLRLTRLKKHWTSSCVRQRCRAIRARHLHLFLCVAPLRLIPYLRKEPTTHSKRSENIAHVSRRRVSGHQFQICV
jgi:hypothetical protein